jgi:DNA modification methylase/O6-methylguanine-DNA--protein-cysteine methyltransferase
LNKKYRKFLESKAVLAQETGYDGPITLNPNLKPHARDIAAWMIRGGNRACFASFGLHKTSIQLQVAESLLDAFPEACALIVCPLGVRREFIKEAKARGFSRTPVYIATDEDRIARFSEGHRLFVTNYERVRDGQLDPKFFLICSLDEASVLRSFGSKTYQEFLPLFETVRFKFVATATPSPNRLKELIHYAGFLGVMDTGQALTRFFKRDPSKAGNLTLHPHKIREFWLWVSTWAVFIQKPSDLGYSDEGYILPEIQFVLHRIPADHATAGYDSWGQAKLLRNAAAGLSAAAKEKRDSLDARLIEAGNIIAQDGPGVHHIIWHDLEKEREGIESEIPGVESITGNRSVTTLEERERIVERFADGEIKDFATKLSLSGSGSNFQEHCWSNIFLGLTYKANDFMQGLHRTQRFGQQHPVVAHLIYTEAEDPVYEELMRKLKEHNALHEKMAELIREFGLNNVRIGDEMRRSVVSNRSEVAGDLFTCVNSDAVAEMTLMPDESVDLVVTSWPFSDHYEYSETYNDFGHNDGDRGFFRQMEFLSPQVMRCLRPGRMYCVHAKDRIVYGSVSGDGMYTVNPFSDKCVSHLIAQGFKYCGRITVVTDVVRENNQTYRLGWSENSKDGTKMGVGSPEYVLLFRKLPTDHANSYADVPVMKSKDDYTRARWQFDAHALWRSSGDRFLTPEECAELPMAQLRKAWLKYSCGKVYDFHEHVRIAQELEKRGILPSSFMALEVANPGAENVWDDVTRMRTLNSEQARKGWEQHVCPLQRDIVERLIVRYSNPGEVVLDMFGGIGTVCYEAVLLGRRGYSIELNEQYHRDAVAYARAAEQTVLTPTLFDLLPEDLQGANDREPQPANASPEEREPKQ